MPIPLFVDAVEMSVPGVPTPHPEPATATGIGLSIGLDEVSASHYDGWSGNLDAAEHDARAMAAIAAERGFETNLLLTRDARADDVLAAIARAAERLRAGDIFLLTYAGHGTQLADTDGDEPDGLDEAWVLYDRMLFDDEVRAALRAFRPDVRVVTVADTCHSRSSTRDHGRVRHMPSTVAAAAYRLHRSVYDRRRSRGVGDDVAAHPRALLLAACQDEETAGEDERHGYFTAALLTTWDGGAFRGGYADLLDGIRRHIAGVQRPDLTLGSDSSWAIEQPFSVDAGSTPGATTHPGTSPAHNNKENTMSTSTIDRTDNWAEVYAALTAQGVVLDQRAPAPVHTAPNGEVRGARGGVTVRVFWWGFHIEIDHPTLVDVLSAADTVNRLVGLIGSSIPSPAAPFIGLAAAFVAGSIAVVRAVDQGHGVYISMSWFAPGAFVPTPVQSRGGAGGRTILLPGQRLEVGRTVHSADGSHRLTLEADGDLVLRNAAPKPLWRSGTAGSQPLLQPAYVQLDDDGALTLRSEVGLAIWSGGVASGPSGRLEVTDAGSVLLTDGTGRTVWESDPGARRSRSRGIVTASNTQEVGWGKKMESAATLYGDGTLVLDSMTRNDNWFAGLRGRTLIVISDAAGRKIWVSRIFEDPTRCSVPDLSCASHGRVTHVEDVTEAVGQNAARLDIYHGDDPRYGDLRNAIIDFIKSLGDIAEAVKAQLDRLQKN